MQSALFVLAAALAAPVSLAQSFAPAPEMARFDAAIGHWEGTGTWRAEADDDPVAWTCTVEMTPILDGHYVEEHSLVRFQDPEESALSAYALYGWDRERGEYVAFVASSAGLQRRSAAWIDEHTFTTGAAGSGPDGLVVDREVSAFDGDSWTVSVHRSAGTGAPFVHVAGELKRTEGESAAPREAAAHSGEPADAMRALVPTLGSWRLSGSVKPMPGMGDWPVAAREDNLLVCGGHVLVSRVQGDPSPLGPTYAAVGLMAWDSGRKAWSHAMVDSMGACTWGACHPGTGGELIFMNSGRYFGMPSAERSVLTIEDGSLVGLTTYRLLAANDPEVVFEVTYERIE